MIPRAPPLALLQTFEAAARRLSFKEAAAELHVTPAAVSQQIKALELHLGGPLFLRLTRAVALSPRGAALLPAVQQGLACLDSAVGAARSEGAPPQLSLTAPPSFATHWLIPRLPDFYRRHPGVELSLSSSSATVGPGGDASALAALESARVQGRSAMAVLYGAGGHAGFSVEPLMRPQYLPVCAPGLATASRPLRTPADLVRQMLIHDDTLGDARGPPALDAQPAWGWPQWLVAAGVEVPEPLPGRHFSNAVLAIEAALAGHGVALAARVLVAQQVAAGNLVQPFDLALPSPCSYFLVAPAQALQQPAAAALRAWLVEQAGDLD